MKPSMKYIKSLALVPVIALGLASCQDQPDAFRQADGVPVLHYVRYVDQDVLITQAFMEETVCLVGDNLRSINQLWFNDQKAVLNTSYMTDNTLLVSVPKEMAVVETDKIYMITAAKDTVTFDFKVLPPAPIIRSMSNEWAAPGTVASLYGDYFIGTEENPVVVEFPNGEVTDFKKVSKTELQFVIPETAVEGKIKVTSISGTAASSFHYRDSRGIITNFDGATDVVPQGWNIKVQYKTEGGVDGQYVELGPSTLDEDGGWNEELKLPFWCGNWNGDPMSITSGAGVPICNFIDMTNYSTMAFKMELCIPKENPWSSGAMQIVFTNAETCANDSWQNNTYIQPDAGLCRALYIPWKDTGSFDTNGEWITVTIPISDFKYNADGTLGTVPLQSPKDFASLVIWPWNGGVAGTECNPIFRYDNIRVVPNK
ncbi:MAG: glycan-binding surface protein [Candidatus Cryptobacteroides sp.]